MADTPPQQSPLGEIADNTVLGAPTFAAPTDATKALVTILHTERRMKVYGVTENELRTLTMINVAVAALFSLGTGCLAFGLDLHKDLLMATIIPDQAKVLSEIVRPATFIGASVFYLLGGIAWYIRGGFISTIKKETSS